MSATLQERSGAISGGARDRRNTGLRKPAYVGPGLVEGRMCLCGAWRRANRAALLQLDQPDSGGALMVDVKSVRDDGHVIAALHVKDETGARV